MKFTVIGTHYHGHTTNFYFKGMVTKIVMVNVTNRHRGLTYKEEFLLYEILAIAVKALVSSAKSVIIIIVGSFIPLQTIPKNYLYFE